MGEVKHNSPNCACGFNTAGDEYVSPGCDPSAPPEGRVIPALRSPRPRVRLLLGDIGPATVEVNGVNVANAVLSLDLHAGPRERELRLDLRVHETVVDGAAAVSVPQATHDALVALGWIPPGGTRAELPPDDVDPVPAKREGPAAHWPCAHRWGSGECDRFTDGQHACHVMQPHPTCHCNCGASKYQRGKTMGVAS